MDELEEELRRKAQSIKLAEEMIEMKKQWKLRYEKYVNRRKRQEYKRI
jgi:hypothetical protein